MSKAELYFFISKYYVLRGTVETAVNISKQNIDGSKDSRHDAVDSFRPSGVSKRPAARCQNCWDSTDVSGIASKE